MSTFLAHFNDENSCREHFKTERGIIELFVKDALLQRILGSNVYGVMNVKNGNQ